MRGERRYASIDSLAACSSFANVLPMRPSDDKVLTQTTSV